MTNLEQQHVDLDRLGDLIDDRLSPEQRRGVEAHLAACPSCSERRDRLEALLGVARSLPGEIDPPATLWHGVRARIAPERSRVRQGWLLAAAALILVAVSSSVTALLVRRQTVVVVRPTAPPALTVAAPLRVVDADYAAAIRELNETLDERRSRLDPTTIAKVEASLHVIDLAIGEARRALAADPANVTLLDLLAANYERKLELLRRANALLPRT